MCYRTYFVVFFKYFCLRLDNTLWYERKKRRKEEKWEVVSFYISRIFGMFLVNGGPIVIHLIYWMWLFVTALPWFLWRFHGCFGSELTCLHVHMEILKRVLCIRTTTTKPKGHNFTTIIHRSKWLTPLDSTVQKHSKESLIGRNWVTFEQTRRLYRS